MNIPTPRIAALCAAIALAAGVLAGCHSDGSDTDRNIATGGPTTSDNTAGAPAASGGPAAPSAGASGNAAGTSR